MVFDNIGHVSPYARILEIGRAEVEDQHTTHGIVYTGKGQMLVAKIRDISIETTFRYNGHPVDRLHSFCAFVDPAEECARAVETYDLGYGQKGEIIAWCRIEESWIVVRLESYAADPYSTFRQLTYLEDQTRRLREVGDYRTSVPVDEIIWSTNWDEAKRQASVERARKMFLGGGTPFSKGWAEKMRAEADNIAAGRVGRLINRAMRQDRRDTPGIEGV